MTAFLSLVGTIATVQTSIGSLVTAEGNLQTAAADATSAVDEESDALAGHSLSTSLDTTAASSTLLQSATQALAGVVGSFTTVVNTAAGTLSGNLVSATGVAVSAIGSFSAAVNTAAWALSGNLVSAVRAAASAISSSMTNAAEVASSALASVASGAYGWGASIGSAYASGIYSSIGEIESAASAAADAAAAYLAVHSNAKKGALSELEDWGPNLIKTFREGILTELPSLNKMFTNLSVGNVDMTIGKDSLISDLIMLQDTFASLEQTILNLGTGLQTVDLSTPIIQATTDSEGFRTAMEANGARFAMFITDITTCLGHYVNLATTMTDLTILEEKLGEGGENTDAAFGYIKDYTTQLTTFTPQLATALDTLKTVWDENSDAIKGGVSVFVEEADEFARHSLTTALDAATESSSIFGGASSTLMDALNSLIPTVSAAANAISDSFTAAASSAASTLSSLAGSAYGWGRSLMSSFADGLYSQMGAITDVMAMAAGIVDSYIGVHSNTKLGALSHLEDFGPNLVKTFAEGIQGEIPSLNKILGSLSMGGVPVQGGLAGGNSTKTVYMTVHQNISSKGDADYAVHEIERLMKRPQIV